MITSVGLLNLLKVP